MRALRIRRLPIRGRIPPRATWRPLGRLTPLKLRRLPISRRLLASTLTIPVTLSSPLQRLPSRHLPLPDYDQPPPPTDGYIWTPGYWAWGPGGYYWVPGAWVEPPYMGALWTPGYWGFYGGRYMFYPGHWGLHIGFYGGINYGFGYFGLGYEGGYWNANRFFYNRVYNRLNTRVVHNVYSYNAGNRGFDNRGSYNRENNNYNNNRNNNYNNNRNNNNYNNNRNNSNPRPSFRGGQNGVQARPQPAEGTAWREPTAPRMSTQVQHEQNYWRGSRAIRQPESRPARHSGHQPAAAGRPQRPAPASRRRATRRAAGRTTRRTAGWTTRRAESWRAAARPSSVRLLHACKLSSRGLARHRTSGSRGARPYR